MIASIAALANAAHALRRGIVYWLTVPSSRWAESPSKYLDTWAVIAVSAAVSTALLTSGFVLARRKSRVEFAVVLGVPLVLFASQLPLYWYIRRGFPSSWYVCPNEREAYAAPLAILAGLAFYAVLTRLKWPRTGA
jgi:hypothetical protein